ncbi:MAG: hypothetical protein JWP63_2277 [Candidatus Solibacter sp.]|nr:hypothetical protein [Candidatus Solibacter sp.]
MNGAAIQATINSAIAIYESTFADPITVSIKFQSSNSGLGSSSTFFANVAYQTYPNALIADGKSADDAVALAGLPAGPNNPVNGPSTINVKTANLRAVGINVNPPAGQPDGTITLNTVITTPGSPGTTAQYFLMPVVMHEINEVFGLGSSLPGISIGTIFPRISIVTTTPATGASRPAPPHRLSFRSIALRSRRSSTIGMTAAILAIGRATRCRAVFSREFRTRLRARARIRRLVLSFALSM